MEYAIPDSHRKMLYKLAFDIHELFGKHQIMYWCDGGTLLGCLRENGLIPWDDDLDFGLLPKDFKKVKEIQNEITQLGYKIEVHPSIFKIFIQNEWHTEDKRVIGTPTLDLFVYNERKIKHKKMKERFIALMDDDDYKRWPFARHKKADLFPLKKMKFGPLELWCPNNGVPYCDLLYPNWKTVNVIDIRNEDNGKQKDNKIVLPRAKEIRTNDDEWIIVDLEKPATCGSNGPPPFFLRI